VVLCWLQQNMGAGAGGSSSNPGMFRGNSQALKLLQQLQQQMFQQQ
jgi:hypothetical protein